MRLLLLFLLAGCGSKSGLSVGGTPSRGPDGSPGRPDLSMATDATVAPTACERSCGFCTPVGPVIEIAERGQRPDVAWGAGVVLVAHDDPAGNSVVAVSLDGERLWSEPLGGTQRPRIAYDESAGAGLVAFDSGVRWLGADGRPVGDTQRIDLGHQLAADVSVVDEGFGLVLGAFTAAAAPPLFFARVGRTPEPIGDPMLFDAGGPWLAGEHSVDARGRATFGAVTRWDGSGGFIYDLTGGGRPEAVDALEVTGGPVLGMARGLDGEVLLLRDSRSGLTLQKTRPGSGTGVSTWLGMDPRGQDGALVTLGERSVALVTSSVSPTDGVTLGCVNPRSAMSVDWMDELAEQPTLSARAAPTPEGLAVVWTEINDGEPAPRLRLLDCCIRE